MELALLLPVGWTRLRRLRRAARHLPPVRPLREAVQRMGSSTVRLRSESRPRRRPGSRQAASPSGAAPGVCRVRAGPALSSARPASLTRTRRAGSNRVVRVQRITKEQLKERFDRGDLPTLLDVRLKYPYEHSTLRLPGALRGAAGRAVIAQRAAGHGTWCVYDSDPGEIVSARVARDLFRQGYQVSVLKGGLPDWVAANYPTEPKGSSRAVPAASGSPDA